MTDETNTFADASAKADAPDASNPASKNKDKERIVDKLIKIAINQSDGNHPDAGGLFHAPNSVAYADIRIGGRRETWSIRSRGFRQWLVRVYYEVNKTAPNSEALQTAIGLAEARAVIDVPEREVFVRTGAYGGKLSTSTWRTRTGRWWRSTPLAGASSPLHQCASGDRPECGLYLDRFVGAPSTCCVLS